MIFSYSLQWAAKKEQILTVSFSNYHEGNDVIFSADMKGQDRKETDSQKFTLNSNGTISPLNAPELVLGMEETEIKDQFSKGNYEI